LTPTEATEIAGAFGGAGFVREFAHELLEIFAAASTR
jgi:hypothetical protein